MNRTLSVRTLVLAMSLVAVAGCRSDGAEVTSTPPVSIPKPSEEIPLKLVSGNVIDGYIRDAQVCVAGSLDGNCFGSPAVVDTTDFEGRFELNLPQASLVDDLDKVVFALASGGVNQVGTASFENELTLIAPQSVALVDGNLPSLNNVHITPLSTLVVELMRQPAPNTFSIETAEQCVGQILGFPQNQRDLLLNVDPLAAIGNQNSSPVVRQEMAAFGLALQKRNVQLANVLTVSPLTQSQTQARIRAQAVTLCTPPSSMSLDFTDPAVINALTGIDVTSVRMENLVAANRAINSATNVAMIDAAQATLLSNPGAVTPRTPGADPTSNEGAVKALLGSVSEALAPTPLAPLGQGVDALSGALLPPLKSGLDTLGGALGNIPVLGAPLNATVTGLSSGLLAPGQGPNNMPLPTQGTVPVATTALGAGLRDIPMLGPVLADGLKTLSDAISPPLRMGLEALGGALAMSPSEAFLPLGGIVNAVSEGLVGKSTPVVPPVTMPNPMPNPIESFTQLFAGLFNGFRDLIPGDDTPMMQPMMPPVMPPVMQPSMTTTGPMSPTP